MTEQSTQSTQSTQRKEMRNLRLTDELDWRIARIYDWGESMLAMSRFSDGGQWVYERMQQMYEAVLKEFDSRYLP